MHATRMKIKKQILVLVLLTILLITINLANAPSKSEENFESDKDKILLKSREFVPTKAHFATLTADHGSGKKHIIIQFQENPTEEEKIELEKQGIKLLSYIPNHAWLATVTKIPQAENIVGTANLNAEDKLSSSLKAKNYGPWAITDEGIILIVQLHDDINFDSVRGYVETYGLIGTRINSINSFTLSIDENKINELANEDFIKWVDQVPPPLTALNDGIRSVTGVDAAHSAPYNLNGSNITILIYDDGAVDFDNTDLEGRVTDGESATKKTHPERNGANDKYCLI